MGRRDDVQSEHSSGYAAESLTESTTEYCRRTPDLTPEVVRCQERWRLTVYGVRQTERLGERLGGIVKPGAVIVLDGDLGAGKTTFVRGLARGMGLAEDVVTSPTFTLIHEYDGEVPLYHCDAYRLDLPEEFFGLGIDEYLSGDGVCVIEWGSKVKSGLPPERLEIVLRRDGETGGPPWLEAEGGTAAGREPGAADDMKPPKLGAGGRPLTYGCGGAEHWDMTEDDVEQFRRHIDMCAVGDKPAAWLKALRDEWESGRR